MNGTRLLHVIEAIDNDRQHFWCLVRLFAHNIT